MAYEPSEPYDESSALSDGDTDVLSSEQQRLIDEHLDAKQLNEDVEFELRKLRGREQARERLEEERAADRAPTWVQVDHDVAFNMSRDRLMPDIGHMTETPNSPPLPLFYVGKINGVHGDSESGKSWLMQYVSVQEIMGRRHVLYVDFEDDAGGVYRRLIQLGASEDAIREFFHYVNPQNKLTVFENIEWHQLISMEATHSLAVVDGVTEAMSLENLTGRDEGEVAKWHSLITKPLAVYGWGVGMIDHTPHGESRVIGSQHKRSAITGVSYSLDSVSSFAPKQCGKSVLRVEKDRPGWIRGEAAPGARPQWYGTFVLDETLSYLQPSIWPWKPEEEGKAEGYDRTPPHHIMRAVLGFVKDNPGAATRTIRVATDGKTESVNWAIKWLVDEGYLRTSAEGRTVCHYHDHDMED